MSKKIYVRPGKTQSKAAFVVGIIFCLIGLFVVIPIFGPFGLLWTAVAGWITYTNYRNGFTDEPLSHEVIEIEDDGDERSAVSYMTGETCSFESESGCSDTEDVETRLKKLQSLHQQALITDEEYEAKRKEILNEL